MNPVALMQQNWSLCLLYIKHTCTQLAHIMLCLRQQNKLGSSHKFFCHKGTKASNSSGRVWGRRSTRRWAVRVVCALTRGAKSRSFNYRRGSFLLAFLLFHSSILKPNFNLRFVQFEGGGHLHSARPSQVLVEVKLFLKFCELLGGKIGAYYVLLAVDPIFGDFRRRKEDSLD